MYCSNNDYLLCQLIWVFKHFEVFPWGGWILGRLFNYIVSFKPLPTRVTSKHRYILYKMKLFCELFSKDVFVVWNN